MKVCPKCEKDYDPTSPAQVYCVTCGLEHKKQKARDYHRKHYVRKGYNQYGENNNNWKGGIGTYKSKPKKRCERCGGKNKLLWHHKDRDRYNNTSGNLECLCKRCHQIEHQCWKVLPKGVVLSKIAKKNAKLRTHKRNTLGQFC